MKRNLALVLCIALVLALFVGCASNEQPVSNRVQSRPETAAQRLAKQAAPSIFATGARSKTKSCSRSQTIFWRRTATSR